MKEEHFQIIRWGIPGWCFLSFTGLFFGINRYITHTNPHIVARFIEVFQDKNSIVITLIIGSSLPIGFLIYQVHKYLWWNLCYFSSEWTIDLRLIPKNMFEEEPNKGLLQKMNEDTHEERRTKFWAWVLASSSFILPHLALGNWLHPWHVRYDKRYEALKKMKERKNEWTLAHMIWQLDHQADNGVRKRNYEFSALGTITFSAGCAYLLFLLVIMLDWDWRFTSLDNIWTVLLYTSWILITILVIAFLISGIVINGIKWIQGKTGWNIGFQTTVLLWSGALLVLAEFFTLGAFPEFAKVFLGRDITLGAMPEFAKLIFGRDIFDILPDFDFTYPISIRYATSIFVTFFFTVIVIAACRGNRRDVVKERNLRIAHGLLKAEEPEKAINTETA